MKNLKKIIKRLICIVILIYAIVTFCKQQKILNTYASNKAVLNNQIEEANKKKEDLNKIKENANSEQYIEEIAREKLDMYLPNERVYINNDN